MKAINEFSSKPTLLIRKISRKNGASFMFVTLIGLLSMEANAQNTITLSQAINSGFTNKKTSVAAKLDLTISNLQTRALYQKYWPQVSVEYTYLYNPILQTSILPIGVFNPSYPADATQSVQFGTKWTQAAGLTATQPLFDVSIQRHINEAKLQERIAGLSQQQSDYELAYTIAQTYIDIYLKESTIKSLIADTNRTYISYLLLNNKFDEKRLLKSDLNKAKVNHNTAVQLLTDGISQLIQDKVYLLYLMGTTEIEKWDFAIDTTFAMNHSLETIDNQLNVDQLYDLQKLTLQSELTNLQAKSERSTHLPTVGLKGYLGANQFTNRFNPTAPNSWFGISYVGLDVKVPILSGEHSRSTIQQLNWQSDQFLLQQEDKTRQYKKDVYTAKLQLANLQSQLKTQEENIALSTESIAIFQARVTEGQESASTLNSEEAGLQLSKASYETTKKQVWVYWLDYLKASGQLSILWQ